MQPFASSPFIPLAAGWRRTLWLALLVVSSVMFSLFFACATPFAAYATIAAMTLAWSDALIFMLTVWFANQLVGFALLDYPQTADSFIWGGVMGVSAVAATVVSRLTMLRLQNKAAALLSLSAVFLAAMVTYESAMFLAALTPLGGLDGFSLIVIGRVVSVNILALAGLYGLNRLATVMGFTIAPGKSSAW